MRSHRLTALTLLTLPLAACGVIGGEPAPVPTVTVTAPAPPAQTVTVAPAPQETAIYPTWVAGVRTSVPEVSTWTDVQIYNAAVLWCSFVDQGYQQHPNDENAAFVYAFNNYPNNGQVAAAGTLHLCKQYDQPLRAFLNANGIVTG